MRHDDIEVPYEPRGESMLSRTAPRAEPSLGDLFKRLTTDTGSLIRQEADLAKAEIRETGSALVSDARELGMAVGLAAAGSLSLVAFLVIGVGRLLAGRYWLSSLLVGVVALGVGMIMAKRAVSDAKQRSLVPRQTLDTLREDKSWAAEQSREFVHELTEDPTTSHSARR